ncbi:hypothetical protein Y032_0028g1751 [Ancylostoma ceylanicum]|uniref:Uncharacterized protein n=1 Tax=Ancylostoma ceylanicum TaxID=53326 RepID=A0A016USR4_9BILA|nr:hypothetical protein Y032_0028g1751 [Ancylostoma ceylanicum]
MTRNSSSSFPSKNSGRTDNKEANSPKFSTINEEDGVRTGSEREDGPPSSKRRSRPLAIHASKGSLPGRKDEIESAAESEEGVLFGRSGSSSSPFLTARKFSRKFSPTS